MSIKVRKDKDVASLTDKSLLISNTATEVNDWDKNRIIDSLMLEANLDKATAEKIAKQVDKRLSHSGLKVITTRLIREVIDNILLDMGLLRRLDRQSTVGVSMYDLNQMLRGKSLENSNVNQNNPEMINFSLSENIMRQFALSEVFSKDVASAHLSGVFHVHDMGMISRVYCSGHSIEYIKKYGLQFGRLDTRSTPAHHAHTLTGHLNTFLSVMQAYYAGALGLSFLNIFYAPFIRGLSKKEIMQEAQYLVYSMSQNAFSRGGQSLFIDANIFTGVPKYLKNVPVIKGGIYTGEKYGEYEKEAQMFADALLDVWMKGDASGRPFSFPKLDLNIDADSFSDPEQRKILEKACEVASVNGSTYFIFNRNDEAIVSACCRLRSKIVDPEELNHPESMRFCGFANVTINLPQLAYRSKGNWDKFYEKMDNAMGLAMKAHMQRKKFIQSLMVDGGPLWEIGKNSADGKPYVDLDKATYIIGMVGLNECVQFMSGKQLHESEDAFKLGIKVIAAMKLKTGKLTEENKVKVLLEESPAESAASRLAKLDLKSHPEETKNIVKGIEGGNPYYTNSCHFAANAPISLMDRIIGQSKFHPLIESGAITHAFVGEKLPSRESILNLIEKVYKNTHTSQMTISPEFTVCNACNKTSLGLKEKCVHCGSDNVYGITRIVGYFSKIQNWNAGKKMELKDRESAVQHYQSIA